MASMISQSRIYQLSRQAQEAEEQKLSAKFTPDQINQGKTLMLLAGVEDLSSFKHLPKWRQIRLLSYLKRIK